MRRISLAVLTISALFIGFTQVASTGAVPAKLQTAALHQTGAEPTERQMRQAFEGFLTALVSGTLALVAETGGPDAVRKVRQNGNDRFEVRSFRKLDCTFSTNMSEYLCGFAIDVVVAGGNIQRTMTGRFVNSANGLVVADAK